MSWTDVVVAACVLALVAVLVVDTVRERRRREREQRMHAARLAAMKLVVNFEHTPVRGASRDRSLHGKARRAARRQ